MKKLFTLLCFIGLTVSTQAQLIDSTKKAKDYRFRLGGYGEILYQHMDYGPDRYNPPKGAKSDNRSIIDIPRMIVAFDYKFRSDIELNTEIEFEHGGTGGAMELEYEEMGEYEAEVEKGGEVVLEQFSITKTFSEAFKLKIGHFILPVGQLNAHHLPIEYLGAVRSEGEVAMMPTTWHETGIAVLGKYKNWKYELQLVNGLDANGFTSANWIAKGRQTKFEYVKMTDPAMVLRIDNTSIKNLRLSVSGYLGNSTKNTAKPEKMDHIKGQVSVGSFDFNYRNQRLIARGNIVYGNLGDSEEISSINKGISKNIQFSRTPVAQNALTYSVEAGVNFYTRKRERITPFIRYEYYNTMEKTEGVVFADARFKRSVLTIGANYYVLPNLALKADYAMRKIDGGNYNNENTISLALVYSGWYVHK